MLMLRRLISSLALILLISGGVALPALAATTDQGVVRSYASDESINNGMIVALDAHNANKVVPLTSTTVTDMFGVAIPANQAPITETGTGNAQVYVATAGQYNVLVSTENGVIHTGDFVSISSLNGIGMKAGDDQPTVLGRAASDLTSSAIVEHGVSLKTTAGTQTVDIGVIPVAVAITTNPAVGHGTGNLPGFLQIASSNIASKPVAASRVYAGLAVLLAAVVISGGVLYSGIRASLLAIGRNPLARHSILRGLFQTVLTGLGVFLLGLFGVYLLLRL